MRFLLKRNPIFRALAATALASGMLLLLAPVGLRPAGPCAAAEPAARGLAPRQLAASTGNALSTGLQREREGTTLIDVPGYFKLTGDRATFFPASGEIHYLALENLNLERIATAISDIPEQIPWVVSGSVTEYRGANYLLVTKAILQNAPAAPNRRAPSSEPAAPRRASQAY